MFGPDKAEEQYKALENHKECDAGTKNIKGSELSNIFPYINNDGIETATYTDGKEIEQPNTISWNHSLAEVFQALKKQGFSIEDFNEYDFSPYDCFSNTVEISAGKFQIKGLEGKLPMVYSIVAKLA